MKVNKKISRRARILKDVLEVESSSERRSLIESSGNGKPIDRIQRKYATDPQNVERTIRNYRDVGYDNLAVINEFSDLRFFNPLKYGERKFLNDALLEGMSAGIAGYIGSFMNSFSTPGTFDPIDATICAATGFSLLLGGLSLYHFVRYFPGAIEDHRKNMAGDIGRLAARNRTHARKRKEPDQFPIHEKGLDSI